MKTKSIRLFAVLAAAVFNVSAESPKPAPECCVAPLANTTNLARKSIYQLDAKFTTDGGRPFSLVELRGRPVVLLMFFASCGYACPLLVEDVRSLRGKLPEGVRDRAAFVLVSFDSRRDTPEELAHYRQQRSLGEQWSLLHADDEEVRELAALIGVKFKREADGGFAHSNAITLLNPEGEIVHQRIGLKGGLDEAALALAATVQKNPSD
ncbi:MAG: SCO family protein [Opitutaceae bacterium]